MHHSALRHPHEGYDAVARSYDAWKWQRFWDLNEVPVVQRILPCSRVPARVLDIGTGTGRYARIFAERGNEVAAMDISREMLTQAASHVPRNVRLLQGVAQDIPQSRAAVDVVVCARVLSHVPQPAAVLAEIRRVLRPDGLAVLTDIDSGHDYDCTSIPVGATEVVNITTYKWSLGELTSLAEAAGLRLVASEPITLKSAGWVPELDRFSSLDPTRPTKPISWVAVFRSLNVDCGYLTSALCPSPTRRSLLLRSTPPRGPGLATVATP